MKVKVFAVIMAVALLGACTPQEQEAPVAQDTAPAPELVDEGPEEHITFRPDDMDWGPSPSLEPNLEVAVLEGDPSEPGVFTMRIKIPDGGFISPHWHENVERVTVLSGTFHLGHGEELDQEAAEALEPGTYTSMPREMRHFAIAEGETIIQLTSVGPWVIHYVNPEDDPRLREE